MAAPAPYLALPIQWPMLEAHLDEAGFLWRQWERALVAPDYVLGEVAELEGRLLAHLDALVLGGQRVAERLLVPALEGEELSLSVAAALALLLQQEGGVGAGVEVLLSRFVEGEDAARAGIRRALQLTGGAHIEGRLRALLDSAPPPAQAAILDVLGYWRADPGPVLSRMLTHEEPEVRAAAFRAARGLPAKLEESTVALGLRSALPSVRQAALEAGLLCASRQAWDECRQRVKARQAGGGLAMLALASAGGATHQRLLLEALEAPETRRDALRALGLLGTREAAHACLSLMREAEHARLAGEAFSTMTGLALTGELQMEASQPEVDESEEEVVEEYEPEQELPLPAVRQVEAWWARQAPRFEPGRRYLHGQPFGHGALLSALREGAMYRRRGLAWELSLRTGGQFVVRTDALTRVQYAQLEMVQRVPVMLFSRSPEGGSRGF